MASPQRDELFCDLKKPLDLKEAQIEAARCYFCYDAPCIQACPTSIDIPSFIRKIQTSNLRGSAMDILSANIMGGTCARVCPVETLCENSCVRNKSEEKPVQIGQLQRFATDYFYSLKENPFKRKTSTGKQVAIVGAGPAGLACAHELALNGHTVVIYESKSKAGGLNEFGLAPYKITNDWAQKEVAFILSTGGISIKYGQSLGSNISLDELRKNYDAVFLGMGLGGTNKLGVEGEDLAGVADAVAMIEQIRQTKDLSGLKVEKNVVVIGGGNTAIDIAVEMKKLGTEEVHLVYRRGEDQMGATWHEREIAQLHGVRIKTWAKPHKILGSKGKVSEIEFEKTELGSNGSLRGTGEFFRIQAQQIFKAIGQTLAVSSFGNSKNLPEISNGKLVVDKTFQTTIKGVYAGGDCNNLGEDLTVTAVAHGKKAAGFIHALLTENKNG